jgi:hypothetical protein
MTNPAATAVIEEFIRAFNATDGEGVRDTLHFPHVMMSVHGTEITATVEDFVYHYADLAQTEGWHHTELLEMNAIQIADTKVHFTVRMTRHNAEGEIYNDISGLWIVTLMDGHWGIQVRSMFHDIK